jgi:peptidoglycan/xylan/chitin deacetylase (PgdA/CDA1 family)
MSDRSVLILNWHGIGRPQHDLDDGEDRTWVRTTTFERILDAVASRPDVRHTFDDGNMSDVEIALPRLVERGLTAQFFVLAGRIGEGGRLDEGEIRKLVDAGMTVGSHGWAHRDWRALSPADTHDEYRGALATLTAIIERPVDAVAIPFGSYDRTVLRSLRHSRVRRVYTSDGGRTRPDRWLQSRFSVRHDTTADDVRRMLEDRPSARNRALRSTVLWAKRNRFSPAEKASQLGNGRVRHRD